MHLDTASEPGHPALPAQRPGDHLDPARGRGQPGRPPARRRSSPPRSPRPAARRPARRAPCASPCGPPPARPRRGRRRSGRAAPGSGAAPRARGSRAAPGRTARPRPCAPSPGRRAAAPAPASPGAPSRPPAHSGVPGRDEHDPGSHMCSNRDITGVGGQDRPDGGGWRVAAVADRLVGAAALRPDRRLHGLRRRGRLRRPAAAGRCSDLRAPGRDPRHRLGGKQRLPDARGRAADEQRWIVWPADQEDEQGQPVLEGRRVADGDVLSGTGAEVPADALPDWRTRGQLLRRPSGASAPPGAPGWSCSTTSPATERRALPVRPPTAA